MSNGRNDLCKGIEEIAALLNYLDGMGMLEGKRDVRKLDGEVGRAHTIQGFPHNPERWNVGNSCLETENLYKCTQCKYLYAELYILMHIKKNTIISITPVSLLSSIWEFWRPKEVPMQSKNLGWQKG